MSAPFPEPAPTWATLARMRETTGRWGTLDQRGVFLRCYEVMTVSMLEALSSEVFEDPVWVTRLLERFAGYYFDALDAYEQDPSGAPTAWRLAHDACLDPDARPLQRLLLGINAHVNYDLALALHELLEPDWGPMPVESRESRLRDYVRVNQVIAATVDQVQDQLVEPLEPVLRVLDVLLGGADELVASRLLDRWRDGAWEHGLALLDARSVDERASVVLLLETEAVHTARLIMLGDPPHPH